MGSKHERNVSRHPSVTPLPSSSSSASSLARNFVAKDFEDSSITDETGSFPTFQMKELKLGKVLGKGGFSTVWEVRAFHVDSDEATSTTTRTGTCHNHDDDDGNDDTEGLPSELLGMESRKFIAKHCLREETGDARYAVKKLSKETVQSSDQQFYLTGIIDVAAEVRFLSAIEHPNIVKLRAVAASDPFTENYFIVMDRLYDTLEVRIKKWKSRAARSRGFVGFVLDRKSEKAEELYMERIVAAYDLAAAIGYLHNRNIIFRDLKPENIGFE